MLEAAGRDRALAEQFDDLDQQHQASELGLWMFLATEVLFFGGLFLAYTVYRWAYPSEFADIARETEVALGAINTAVLLTSSFSMALAVGAAERGESRKAAVRLAITFALGVAFLAVKTLEYAEDIRNGFLPSRYEGPPQLFISLYYAMTGLHAFHVTAGLAVIAWAGVRAWRREFDREHFAPVELVGLYWHFVDLIWVFLFPMLYLIERHP